MGEDTREIEREIRDERADLDRNLHELRRQTRGLTDWRTQYRNHPGPVLTAAFSAGLILGLVTASRGRPAASFEASRTSRLAPASLSALRALGDNPRAKRQVGETWEQILDTLIGLASVKVIDALSSYVPGFRQEFESRHPPVSGRASVLDPRVAARPSGA